MRSLLIASLLAISVTSAFAQSKPITLHLSVDEVNLIVGHLDGRWADLNPVVQIILTQTQMQLKPPPEEKAEGKKKADDKNEDSKP